MDANGPLALNGLEDQLQVLLQAVVQLLAVVPFKKAMAMFHGVEERAEDRAASRDLS